jgi:hypothetical protein
MHVVLEDFVDIYRKIKDAALEVQPPSCWLTRHPWMNLLWEGLQGSGARWSAFCGCCCFNQFCRHLRPL